MKNITVRNISASYGSNKVLHGINVDIRAGELFFLLGPSGCGKTTLLRIIAGLAAPDAGTIRFGDTDVTSLPPERRNIGMVFQNYALWPHMTVDANVAYGLRCRGIARKERKDRVAEALGLVRLSGVERRRPNALSGGQQQRVAVARALIIRPDVLLLDEPLSNLDAKLRAEMRSEIRRICREIGVTTICVTHDQEEALGMADQVAVMFDGRIEQVGSPVELWRKPRTPRVAGFLGEGNVLHGRSRPDQRGMVIETPAGSFRTAVSNGIAAGVASIFFRPEDVVLADSSHQENVFAGTPVDVVFSTHGTVVDMDCNGERVRALFRHEQAGGIKVGTRIQVHARPESLVAFGHEGGAA